jgi:hypothetical protein
MNGTRRYPAPLLEPFLKRRGQGIGQTSPKFNQVQIKLSFPALDKIFLLV